MCYYSIHLKRNQASNARVHTHTHILDVHFINLTSSSLNLVCYPYVFQMSGNYNFVL